MNEVAELLFNYLRDAIYYPKRAKLDIEKLPEDFQDLGEGLSYYVECVMETKELAQALAKGDLGGKVPSSGNEIASPLKSLHASLRHLTWQTQQVAEGDYQQRVKFMGEFAEAFNTMIQQLEERRQLDRREKLELQQYISLILSNTPDILLVFDTEGKAVLANEAYKRRNKLASNEDIEGKSFAEMFAPISTDEFLRTMDGLFKEALLTEQTVKTEESIDFGRIGNPRTYQINVTPMMRGDDTLMGTMVVFHDMTEIIRAKLEAERARELAEQATRAKSDFLARMTHEMRTPMSAIIGMTSIGKSSDDIEKKNYSFQKIDDASTHLLGVINDILDMSKIEADKLELSYGEFYLEAMLYNVKSIVNFQVAEKELNFTVDLDGSIPAVIASDEQRLAQVITNLMSNAVKFTPRHGSITLTARKISETDSTCRIGFTVKDTGIGISEEQQKSLFKPFEQADGSISRQYGGTGLGLAISKRIVDMMNGRIWVESKQGEGATFIFEIEAGKPGKAEETETGPKKAQDGESNDFTGKRIMIAEDVDINREIIEALLEDTGIEITFAFDGGEAVEKFTAAPDYFQLILMDIQMPGTDGYDATRQIRASGAPGAETIPIVAMTANVFKEDVEKCLAAGMNGHLGKPVDLDEVFATFREYLR